MPSKTAPRSDALSSGPHDERVSRATKAALVQQLLASGAVADVAHPLILGLAIVLVWGRMPVPMIVGWCAAVLGATAVRTLVRHDARTRQYPPDRALRLVRLTVAALAMAWGIGAAAAAPDLPLPVLALLLVLFTGLVSGAFTTLTPDITSARLFVAGLLVPLAIGVALNGWDREHVVGLVLIGTYGVFMLLQLERAYRALLERHRMHALLQDSEGAAVREHRYLDALFESAPVAISIIDATGRVERVNPAFTELFGYSAAEAVGHLLDDLIVPAAGRRTAAALQARASAGDAVRAEVDRVRRDGSVVPVRLSAARVEGTGSGDLFVLYEDVTARRRAAEAVNRLATVVESSEDAIYSQTLDGTVVSWNAAAERLFGHTAADMVGKSGNLITPPDRLAELQQLHERLRRGERCPSIETERVRRDGARVQVSLTASAIRNADGEVIGLSKIARDIAGQVAARRTLDEARRAAERAAKARATFLANMSHEIRTPMNAILGLSELMLDTELSAEQRHALDTIRAAADGLLTLLNDVLDFSKIEAEHLDLEHVPFDLHQLVHSTVNLLAVRAGVKRLELLAEIAPDVPAAVRGDPTRLRQVLTNLVGNAIKFTERGEVVVAVAREPGAGHDAPLRFSVRDTGIGISADKLEAIFEEFIQADASTTRHHGGTGLGLAIARRLARLMGGELYVRSEAGQGSEFWFTVALATTDDKLTPTVPPSARALDGQRALVVDDSDTNRRIVREVLTGAGMLVEEAVSAAAGLAALRHGRDTGTPHAIAILDVQMPDRDGFTLAGDIRSDQALQGTKLLIFTSAGRRGDGQRCRELGIEGYLSKPASRTDLLEAVSTVLTQTAAAPDALVTRHAIAESRRHLRILLAEDNPVNQEVAAAMLRKRGHRVDVVANGREALAATTRERYDVVLMDVMMPEMDGYQATTAIRATETGRTLPIVACTAHALAGERERCLAAGMSGYLAKPFKAHDLFAAVENWDEAVTGVAASEPAPAPAVDLESFRRAMRDAGAEEAVAGILETFQRTAPGRLQDLERAVAAKDADAIRRASHAYKSAAATIGARELSTLLGKMEEAARRGAIEGATGGIDGARAAHVAALSELARALSPG